MSQTLIIYKNTRNVLHKLFNIISQADLQMSSEISSTLYHLQLSSIFLGIPILIADLIGNIFCVIVFTSLHTFRNNPCSFYLTCGTFVNIGQLLTDFLTRIMINGFKIDWSSKSLFYCKFRPWLSQACTLISLTCICLATIDQFNVAKQ